MRVLPQSLIYSKYILSNQKSLVVPMLQPDSLRYKIILISGCFCRWNDQISNINIHN